MLAQLLFETRMGNAMLAILERRANLAVVEAEALGETRIPMAADTNHRESDRSPERATIIHNYTTTNGNLTSEGNRLRGLLLALKLYPEKDCRNGNLNGLLPVLARMIEGLDSNDVVCLFDIATQLYGTLPPDGFWQEHQAKWVELA